MLSETGDLRILSIIPPMTQLNTPYPSTAYLTGFLRSRGFHAEQADLSIGLALKLLSVEGLQAIHERVRALPRGQLTASTRFFTEHFEVYRTTLAPTIRFLQGRDASFAHRIASRHYLPEGPRFAALDHYIGGEHGESDAAYQLARTFDAEYLTEIGAQGVGPDKTRAVGWYERASETGSAKAAERLKILASLSD